MSFLSVLVLFFYAFFSFSNGDVVPAIAQIFHYPPNEYCDLDNPRDQSGFSGPEFDLALEIIGNIQWLDDDYEFEFYCICCNDVIRQAVVDDFHMTEVGRKYILTG
jgi:hypothetical protein